MTQEPEKVAIQVKYKGVDQTFQGTLEESWLMLNKFFSELVPTFEIAQKLVLSVDAHALAKECAGLVAFSPEGPNVLAPQHKLTDNETLGLWLLASYLGHKLALLSTDALSKEDLKAKLGKSGKITSTRLGELAKNDFVSKTEGDKFKITTFGVVQMQKDIIPKIKAKIAN